MSAHPETIVQRAAALRSPLDAALAYARHGWAVLPVCGAGGAHPCGCDSPGKHPLTRHGVHDAARDEDQIRRWWARWPWANVGVATGVRSHLAVVDVDPHSGGEAALDAVAAAGGAFPVTFLVATGGGGFHLYYRQPRRVTLPNTVARLPGVDGDLSGIDMRGDGGYVVAPPSLHASGRRYQWARHQPERMADLPGWLLPPPLPPARPALPGHPRTPGGAYGAAALSREAAAVRRLVPGQRNDGLNRAAFALGSLVAGGELAEDVVAREPVAATAHVGLGRREASRTVQSGLRAGTHTPRPGYQS